MKLARAMLSEIQEVKIVADMVSHPSHYNMGGVECIDGIKAALGDKYMGFLIGNVIKYCWRHEHKGGKEDLRKAMFYLEKAIGEYADAECDVHQ